MIESRFRKGYNAGYSESSNFTLSDASNLATIELMKLFPKSDVREGCFCSDCALVWHEMEARFDALKTEIERVMEVAFQEGRTYEKEVRKKD